MSSPHKDEALQSHSMEQVEGSSHPMEQDQEVTLGSSHTTKQVETDETSGPSYEQEASDDMEPLEMMKTRRELARDPNYNPEGDEINYRHLRFHIIK